MYEKYLRRNCDLQPEIKNLCYAQFVKMYSSARNLPKGHKFKHQKVPKQFNSDGQLIIDDIIVTKHINDETKVNEDPMMMEFL